LNINEPAVYILFEDVQSSVQYQMDWVLNAARELGIEVLQAWEGYEQTEPIMELLRCSVSNASLMSEDHTEVGLKLLTSISDVPDIMQYLELMGRKEALDLQCYGGLYTGISHVRLYSSLGRDDSMIHSIKKIRADIERLNGHVIVQCAPGYIRSAISVWGNSNEGIEVMRGIKQKFDPTNNLNLGRYVGGI